MGLVVNNLPTEKSPGPGGLHIKFYKHLRNNTNSTQTFPGNYRGGNFRNLLYEVGNILIPKPAKDITRKKKIKTNFLMNRHANI